MTISDGPRTPAEWDAHRELPVWLVTVRLSRTAQFQVHAASPEEARASVEAGGNGVQSMDDLYDPGALEIDHVAGVEAV